MDNNTEAEHRGNERMNVDVLEDETEILNAELRASDDPKAQDRIKELIDERYRALGAATKAQQEFDTLEAEWETLDEWQDKARIREIIKRRAEIVLAEHTEAEHRAKLSAQYTRMIEYNARHFLPREDYQ
jgi:hypothetical protein